MSFLNSGTYFDLCFPTVINSNCCSAGVRSMIRELVNPRSKFVRCVGVDSLWNSTIPEKKTMNLRRFCELESASCSATGTRWSRSLSRRWGTISLLWGDSQCWNSRWWSTLINARFGWVAISEERVTFDITVNLRLKGLYYGFKAFDLFILSDNSLTKALILPTKHFVSFSKLLGNNSISRIWNLLSPKCTLSRYLWEVIFCLSDLCPSMVKQISTSIP